VWKTWVESRGRGRGLHTWGKSLRDSGCPGVIVGDEVCSCPDLSVEVDAGLVDLDKFEGVLVDLGMLLVGVDYAGKDMCHIMCSSEHTKEQFPPQLATYVITGPIPCGHVVHWN
jgi:hypothetical protein